MHIKPTVGRVLWFYPGGKREHDSGGQPSAASVAHVNDNGTVNIGFLQHDGQHRSATGVQLVQEGEPMTEGPCCVWMPYQQGQAKAAAIPSGPIGRPPGWGG